MAETKPPKKETEDDGYDPFAERTVARPTTNIETLAHLMKSAVGTGILAMPLAFKYAGLILGILATMFTALICVHCCYVLVRSAHKLYYRLHVPQLTYAELGLLSVQVGPSCSRWMAPIAKFIIVFGLFVTYFGILAVYAVIVGKNLLQIFRHWFPSFDVNERLFLASLLLPFILLCWIPDLKYLAPVSILAISFMLIAVCFTFYYIFIELPPISNSDYIAPNLWATMPSFFTITIFALEAIGIVMPLENNMEKPRSFLGLCGVLIRGMTFVTIVYSVIGFFGYWRYGEDIRDSISLNFPVHEWQAQTVKFLVSLAVFCTFGLQFFVCMEIAWNCIKEKCTSHPVLYNYVLRTVIVTAAISVAVAVPTIGPFISLIGAFCFSILGIVFPVIIEMFVDWEEGFGKWNWIIWKNAFIIMFGIAALIIGSNDAVKDIIKTLRNKDDQPRVDL